MIRAAAGCLSGCRSFRQCKTGADTLMLQLPPAMQTGRPVTRPGQVYDSFMKACGLLEYIAGQSPGWTASAWFSDFSTTWLPYKARCTVHVPYLMADLTIKHIHQPPACLLTGLVSEASDWSCATVVFRLMLCSCGFLEIVLRKYCASSWVLACLFMVRCSLEVRCI